MWIKNINVIFFIFLFSYQFAHAEWVEVFKASNETYYIDKGSLDLDDKNEIGKFWVKIKAKVSKPLDSTAIEKKIYYEMDCKRRELKTLSLVSYNKNQKVLQNFDPVFPKASKIVPDTVGDGLYTLICENWISDLQVDPERKLFNALEDANECFKKNISMQKYFIQNREKLKTHVAKECHGRIQAASQMSVEYAGHTSGEILTNDERNEVINLLIDNLYSRIDTLIDSK